MKRLVASFFLIASFVPFLGTTLQASILCRDSLNPEAAFANHQSQIADLLAPSISFRIFEDKKVMDVIEPPNPRSGQGYYLFKRIAKTWQSKLVDTKNIFAVRGDPTWPFQVISPKLSFYFGLRFIDANTLLLPNTDLLNMKIDKLNMSLIKLGLEPIALNFSAKITEPPTASHLESPRPENASYSELFTSEFIQQGRFPIDKDEVIHDFSFHFLNILFTQKQLSPLVARGIALLKLSQLIRTLDPSLLQSNIFRHSELRENFINLFFQLFTVEIDNTSGLATIRTLARKFKLQNRADLALSETFYHRNGFSKGISGQRNAPFIHDADFTMGHWLNYFLKDVMEQFDDKTISEYPGATFFNGLKSTRKLRAQVKDQNQAFKSDLKFLLTQFWERFPDTVNTVIARFNDDGEVIAGGLTSDEPAIDSFVRRTQELELALDQIEHSTRNDKGP